MTPEEISKLSDQELNELIALKRGYFKVCQARRRDSIYIWCDSGHNYVKDLPDYCNSWQWAGELLEEIIKNNEMICINIIDSRIGDDYPKYHFYNGILSLTWHKPPNSKCREISESWYLTECEK